MVSPRAKTGAAVSNWAGVLHINSLTIVAENNPIRAQELLVQNLPYVPQVAVLVGVDKHEVEFARELRDGLVGGTLDQLDPIVDAILLERLLRCIDHDLAEFERDDLRLGVLGALIPS